MPRDQRTITPQDILPVDRYELVRAEKKAQAIARKALTRISVGPSATVLFECWDSMWLQIQEMLRIEKGGEAQLADELAAYGPMVPRRGELTATVLFEVADPVLRDRFLRAIGGVEHHVAIHAGGHVVRARAEGDVARTRESDGKASAVHFFHFDFTPEAQAAWKDAAGPAMVVIDHPAYGHAAMIAPAARAFLATECF